MEKHTVKKMTKKRRQEYDDLASELRDKAKELIGITKFWIGLAGAPGSGKTTLAEALRERLPTLLTIIPMDGYHYYRSELNEMDEPKEAHARRGAPFTFNSIKFVNAITIAHKKGKGTVPRFDHRKGDPVEDTIIVTEGPQIILVEGNYLLLDVEPWSQLRTNVFDETWFLNVSISECNRRVRERHIETGLTEEQAQLQVENNDSINSKLVNKASSKNVDRIIQIS